MECQIARTHLLASHAGRLPLTTEAELQAHLEGCAACTNEDATERVLTEVLEQRLPQYPASLALKRRLAAQWPLLAPERPRGWRPWWPWLVSAAAVALLLVVAVPTYQGRRQARLGSVMSGAGLASVMSEAVNDHLRVLQLERPLGVVSDQSHQVKPWFSGRLDFAPIVTFPGDADFPLKGGTVEYFLDRRAAVFVYGRRLHTASLIVFRPEGVPLPSAGRAENTVRGFNVVVWRAGELGYALVSDLNAGELRMLADRLSPPA